MKNQNLFDAVKERIIEATKKEDYTLLELSKKKYKIIGSFMNFIPLKMAMK
jgi:hypothetical protein